ncbi:MAG: hypothetical protein JNM18_07700 [Planctomycetaceae bacterium]|nr:hypothetical protein [Planctomycetaceae bacterium]
MDTRILLMIGIVIASGLLVAAAPLNPAEKSHSGVVISVGVGKLVLADSEGNNEVALAISDRTSVTLDGAPAKLLDLMKGDMAAVTIGDDGVVVSVNAKRDKKNVVRASDDSDHALASY